MSLKGRHALVTGGGRGIGAAISASLAAAGAEVTVLGRTRRSLDAMVEAGKAHRAITADVTDGEALAAAVAAAGPIDILVNNAGGAETAPFLKSGRDLYERMMALNLYSAVAATQAALPALKASQHGRIVMIASTAALKGYPYVSAYCAAKHAVLGLTRSLALELAATSVTVNAICPGYTETDMLQDSIALIMEKTGRSAEAARASLVAANPQKRAIDPAEVANAVLWLCSEGAASVTGQAIAIAGGEVM
ncbi:MAG: SDR family oxidoreductase [Beijerinckiaceae bacterium]|nr:SDR family oxidoreductase [Beijerinckiaceae bacterium]